MALVKKFDHEYPERFSDEIFKYLSINEEEHPIAFKAFESPLMNREYFDKLCDTFRSPHIWKYDKDGWSLRNKIS